MMCGGIFEVVAGGERPLAGAGQNRDPEVLVGHEIVPDLLPLEVAGGWSAFITSGRLSVIHAM